MSSEDLAVEVRDVSKSFKIEGTTVRRGPSEHKGRAPDGRRSGSRFQALDNVTLSVTRGETVGIIGRNGAGKTTLLRIIAGLMQPDSGAVDVDGHAYSVMGMGIGFDRNLSGKDNIQIKGALMGATARQVKERYDWIIDFAELGDYINQPLRTYSKGMLSRLAFAITFAFDPEILIVDEALSGGDGAIRRKAEARLNEINDSGATILLVSHGAGHHTKLCDRCILIDRGRILNSGPPKAILKLYDQLLEATPDTEQDVIEKIVQTDPEAFEAALAGGGGPAGGQSGQAENHFDPDYVSSSRSQSDPRGAQIGDVRLLVPKNGERVNVLNVGARTQLAVDVEFHATLDEIELEVIIKSDEGTELFRQRVRKTRAGDSKAGKDTSHCFKINLSNMLLEGVYYVDAVLRADAGDGVSVQHRVSDAEMFKSLGKPNVEGLVDLSR